MTDITELAQRITERKFHDWSQSVMHDCDFCNKWSLTVKHENGERICASCCDAEYTSKLKVANAALVEALEKSQQHIARQEQILLNQDESLSIRRSELEKAQDQSSKWLEAYHKAVSIGARYEERIAELEEAEQKLCAANVTLDARAELAERRLAELESRTVTAENLQESAYRAGLTAGWNLGLANNNDGFNKCLAAHAAGIKVEGE